MLLQKRHEKARITIELESDNELPFNMHVVIKTPGKAPLTLYQTIGSKRMLSWHYCSSLHKTLVTRDTIWEVWTCAQGQHGLIFSIVFEACQDNAEQIAAENWAELRAVGSDVDPICDFDTDYNDDKDAHALDRSQVARRTQIVMKPALS